MPYLGNGLTKFTTADDLTVSGDAAIDTTTLVVDSTNNRVGVKVAPCLLYTSPSPRDS